MDGTSMACPHVAGAIALLSQAAPNAEPSYLKEVLMDTAVDLGSTGEDNNYGHGRIDVKAAIDNLDPDLKNISLDIITPPPAMAMVGSVVSWEIRVTSHEEDPCDVDVWLSITSDDLPPEMNPYIRILATQITVPPMTSVDREISMKIPDNAPISFYTVDNNLGLYPDKIFGSDWFTIAIFDF
jgi:hypothetical protein